MAYALDQRSFYVTVIRPHITTEHTEFSLTIAVEFFNDFVDMPSVAVDAEMERLSRFKWHELSDVAPNYLRRFGDTRRLFEAHREYPVSSGLSYFMWWGATGEHSLRIPAMTMTHIKTGIAVLAPVGWKKS